MTEFVFYSIGRKRVAAYDPEADKVFFTAGAFPAEIPPWALIPWLTHGISEGKPGTKAEKTRLYCPAEDALELLSESNIPEAVEIFTKLEARFRAPESAPPQ